MVYSRRITEAVSKQMATLGHVSNVYFHPKIHEYAERLIEKLPGNLKVTCLIISYIRLIIFYCFKNPLNCSF